MGVLLSYPLGVHPLFGVLAGSVTLTGGPATGLAFAPLFEEAGVTSASAIAIAAAMLGIISGGLVGGPVGTWLIRRNSLRSSAPPRPAATPAETAAGSSSSGGADAQDLMKHVVIMLAVLWAGEWISRGFTALEVTLPGYIGAMLAAAVMGAGLCGFMLGTTANAVANMGALVQKYGPAPRAFLIVPMVGAFFIDFSNAIVINTFLNLLK